MPRQYSELQQSALCGPVVILNASKYSCSALIIHSGAPLSRVQLDKCTFEAINLIRNMFRILVLGLDLTGEMLDKIWASFPPEYSRDDVFRETLKFLWDSVVEPCLTHIKSMKTSVR